MRTIAFSENYELLINHEDIWLRFLKKDKVTKRITRFIGGCNSAIISRDEKYIIAAGYGLLVINLENIHLSDSYKNSYKKKLPIRIYFREHKNKFWINKVWQDQYNDNVFGFISNLRPYFFTLKEKKLIQFDVNKSKSWAETLV